MTPEDIIKYSPGLITNSASLIDLYEVLDQLTQAVNQLYDDIGCAAGCDRCCTGGNLPSVSLLEWSLIHEYLYKKQDSNEFKQILENSRNIIKSFSEPMAELHKNINPRSENDRQRITYIIEDVLPKLDSYICPFLSKGLCLIYEFRPAKCRAHGYFAIMTGQNEIHLHTCEEEKKRWEDRFKNNQNRNVRFPLWNQVYAKLTSLATDKFSTVLPVWLYFNVKENKLLKEPDTKFKIDEILL